MMKFKEAYIYVGLQFGFIISILLTAPIISSLMLTLAVQFLGLLLLIWAVYVMKSSRFNISPEVKKGASLVKKGPYKLIRHPMYLATLLYMTPLVIEYFSPLRLAFLIALILSLILKLSFEEKLLMKSFADYKDYKSNTWKLIPFIY